MVSLSQAILFHIVSQLVRIRVLQLKTLTVFCVLLCFRNVGFSQSMSWQPTNGPSAEYINSIVVKSNGYIFAGTAENEIYRSTNGGDEWSQASAGMSPNLNILSLAVDSQGVLFAGSSAGEVCTDHRTTVTSGSN